MGRILKEDCHFFPKVKEEHNHQHTESDEAPLLRGVHTTSAAYFVPSCISNLLGFLLCEVNITKVCGSSSTLKAAAGLCS